MTPFTGFGVGTGAITAQTLVGAIAMRRGQPLGPTNDQEIEDFIADALDLLPGTNDVEVRCEGGKATLTGSVPHKRVKRDAGEIAWAIPSVNDVQNNVNIAARRRSRGQGGMEGPATPTGRKQT
jgi:osmotically-inducible protein OsmY